MSELSLFVLITTALVLATGLTYVPLQRSILTEPLLAMSCGLAVGPVGLGWFRPDEWSDKVHLINQACSYTLAIALMATAMRLPGRYPFSAARYQLILVFGGVALMSIISAGVFYVIFGWSALLCLLLGAIVAPTDPVLSTTVVSGKVAEKNLPGRLRDLISGESGANDGAALPFVMLPFLLMKRPETAWSEWLFKVVLYENLLAILFGAGIGYVARFLVKQALRKKFTTTIAFLSYTVALGLLVLAFLELIGCNGIIGVFAAGLAFNFDISEQEEAKDEQVQEMMERLFIVPVFFVFGMTIPWAEVRKLGWAGWGAALLVLLARRIPALLILSPALPPLQRTRDTVFVGWFGPVGVAALYYATHMHEKLRQPEIWAVPSLVIFCSVIAHGVTCYPLTRWYGRSTARVSGE